MQRKKSLQEIANQRYLNIADIQKLLHISWREAKETYLKADKLDQSLGDSRVMLRKVRMESVLKVTGLNLNFILRQIKGTQQG